MASSLIGALRVSLGLNSASFTEDVNKARKRLSNLGKSLKNTGENMTKYVSVPLAGFGALALKTAGDFELAMNNVAAVSGATGKQFEALREQAKEMGKTTQFTASQAADAMGFLAMAGFDANETLKALPGTLQLAASAQMDLGQAADIVSNILTGYGKTTEDLARVNDVLVKAFTSANTNLEQLGEAMKYAGPVASAASVQFEQAAAAISLMGNAGLQGSLAGTALRGALTKMLNPTSEARKAIEGLGISFKDAKGELLPLDQVIQQLEPHANDAGLFMQVFGQRAGPGMAALVSQGSDALRSLTADLENSGGMAQQISDVQMQGFIGSIRTLKSAFEGLQIAIAESGLIDWAAKAATALATWLRTMSETNPEILKWGVAIAGIATALGPVIFGIGAMVSGIAAISPAIAALLPMIATLSKVLIALTVASGPLGLVIAAVGAVVAIWANWGTIGPIVGKMVRAVTSWLKNKLGAVLDWVGEKVSAVTGFFADMYDAVVGNSYVPDMVDEIGVQFARLDDVMVKPTVEATAKAMDAFNAMANGVSGFSRNVDRLGDAADTNKTAYESWLRSASDGFADAIIKAKSFGGVIKSLLAQLAKSELSNFLFNSFTGGKGGSVLGGIGKALKLPGFKDGGSFRVGGAGGIDSQTVAFRATPGERVDISKSDNGGGVGGVTVNVDARGATDPSAVRAAAQQAVIDAAPALIKAAKGQTISDMTRPRFA